MPIKRTLTALAVAAAGAAGCASTPDGPRTAPDYTHVAGKPVTPRARLYVDCVNQAAAAGSFDRTSDRDRELIRFTCSGAPARAFYAALEGWSAQRDSQWTAGGRTWRSTNKVRRDLFGVDYCSARADGDHQCVLILNAGEFVRE